MAPQTRLWKESDMEPITTELRRSMSERSDAFTGVSVLYCEKDKFIQLCDAIDAVHARLEQENDELRKTVYDMRREFDEWKHSLDTGWIRLPVDADGEPICVGDMVVEDGCDVPYKVMSLKLFEDCWDVGECGMNPKLCRHHHAPTVEDVLREFADAILEWSGKSGTVAEVGTWSDVAAEYAAKLQLKEDA